ncbi:MAG: bifunctional 4-hydroxy-2-oxoglutarate aldolase/2-dehydro-3-deoxy-phosphogluconate aldolase [Marinobacter sp.]|uniref:bifunctional 4-hydroxy-2-oxoglutarate aldolase/2-dehydro-3-deoxy-phosphogluconate aldolase n=1 Tax=Marinobacter sp. TaxID=50741 RepID=UPI00299D6C32|nr:bifunctional 4-hydroxy-2-oxoglutarate aldolase/2-dehydro-3-deoxy-phosphogluconate aldolase [Marinobacter sp.]MDX1633700.1 bifunctional 4-hydroxy-2-oxoglutarate aldolase/2-dehydro-3-deoxy-phosphogluconate aldolase [Marinobacter sp.]
MSSLSMQHRHQVQSVLAACPLVPVISIQDPAHTLPLAGALVEGGIRILEVTLRTEHGLGAIRQLRKAFPDVWVGAGTVAQVSQYRQAEAAGAQFVITPGVTRELLEFGMTAHAPLLPGVSTISEMMLGYALGYREFKFFPAEVAGGIPALKAFAGPFPDVSFCPTGGVRRETARDYLALANVAAVGGTWLTPRESVEAGDWAAISELAAGSLADL